MTAVLSARGVTASRGARTVLHDVDVDIRRGEVVAVLGPNGAGKSTLLDVLSGALAPVSGAVTSVGRTAFALQGGDLARRTAQANVELALAWWGVPRSERRARARQALVSLGAGSYADRPVTALSGGERRRVHLGRALAVQADVLLLDEPFVGLDTATRAVLLRDMQTALAEREQTVAVVVHDRAEAWALASRLVVLLGGRVAAAGSPQELLARPPTPQVARFLGYSGELRTERGRLLTRPADVRLDAAGALPATVVGRLAQEDRVLLDLHTERGDCQAFADYPGPATGTPVAVVLTGGVLFASVAAHEAPD